MVPIYQRPADKPSRATLAAEAMLLERDGVWHVGKLYFARQEDATTVRRLEAERIVAEEERLARICAWCDQPIRNGEFSKVVAGRKVHDRCADEYDVWTHDAAHDWRWRSVTNETLVDFEGALVAFGSLVIQDRKTVSMTADGKLFGGYRS